MLPVELLVAQVLLLQSLIGPLPNHRHIINHIIVVGSPFLLVLGLLILEFIVERKQLVCAFCQHYKPLLKLSNVLLHSEPLSVDHVDLAGQQRIMLFSFVDSLLDGLNFGSQLGQSGIVLLVRLLVLCNLLVKKLKLLL